MKVALPGVVMGTPIVLGTRRSRLALMQTVLVRERLLDIDPSTVVVFSTRVSEGDLRQDLSLERSGGGGLFTSGLERLLMDEGCDGAVHSAKDLPTTLGPGLSVAAYPERADPRDVLVTRVGADGVPEKILTGSPRRRAQLKRLFPRAVFGEIRGNVETRLARIAEGKGDATVLARAGLDRLGIDSWPGLQFRTLEVEEMVPAPGQGAIAVEARNRDAERFSAIDDPATRLAVELEKYFLMRMGGGCHSAEGAHADDRGLTVFSEARGRSFRAWPEGAVAFSERCAFIGEAFNDWFRDGQ